MKWFVRSKTKSIPSRQRPNMKSSQSADSLHRNNSLKEDQEILLSIRETLAGTASLNWDDQIPVEEWEGVTVSKGRVTELNLRGKGLSGNIPPTLGRLSALESLVLERNALRGSIPPELGNLTELKDLWLKYNQLSGGLPPELGNLTNLENFTAINNYLTGSIPDTFGNLTNLQELWLGNNKLSGEIPASFGNLSCLRELWLKNNQLTGRIPKELGQLPNLQRLETGKNLFTGSKPVVNSSSSRKRKRGTENDAASTDNEAERTGTESRTARGKYDKEFSRNWVSGDAEATEFFVYILKLDGNTFYAGQTRELRERLMEHRDGDTVSTAGKNPKLVWFTKVSTRDKAVTLEAELKRLCDKNPREVRRRVRQFQDLVEQLDFT